MAPATATVKSSEPAFELPIHARLPRLDLAVDWGSPWDEFRSSVHQFFRGPRAPGYEELPKDSDLQVDWVRDRFAVRSFLAACVWHIIAITLLILPIWGFLPKSDQNLAPVHIELTYVPNSDELPSINLPLPGKKASAGPKVPDPPATRGADTFHPRQTILSEPLRITHPRQTLLQPEAPAAPPKIDTPLPDIIQWSQAPEIAQPKMHYAPSTSAPKIRQRAVRNIDAPEIPQQIQNPSELSIAPSPVVNPAPRMPMMPSSAAAAKARQMERRDAAPSAPDVIEGPSGNSNLPSVVALSSTPAPPAPEVSVPQGNLAARISMSPEGGHGGAPAAPPAPSKSNAGEGGTGGNSNNPGAGGSASNLPAAVSVSGGSGHGGGGIAPSGAHSGGLILHPMTNVPERPTAMMSSRHGPADVSHLDPSLPPETLLSGKQVYTLHVNLPNLTSASGSWVLHFAQLDENYPPFRAQGTLSAPDPVLKVDPEYPPEAVKQHIDGEVVLYAIIRKDGSVDSVQLVKGVDPQLDSNAMKALAKWKFKPGMRDGAPVDIEAVVHIPFSFRKPED